MRLRPRLLRILLSLVVLLLIISGPGSDYRHRFSERFEQQLYDWRMRLAQQPGQDPRVVIVDIDEASLAAIGRWPWPREQLAELVDRLFDHYHIGLLAFDVVFAESDQLLSQQRLQAGFAAASAAERQLLDDLLGRFDPDQRLATALADRPVVLGYAFSSQGLYRTGALAPAIASQPSPGLRQHIRTAPGFTANLALLQAQAMGGGFFDNPALDSDGIYRRVPMLQRFEEQLYPSLSLAVMQTLFGSQRLQLLAGSDNGMLEQLELDGLKIPVDSAATVLVPYRGPQASFPYLPAHEVLAGTAAINALEGAIVLLGTSAAGLLDLRTTPVQNAYPGVEVHANLIAAMLDQRMLQHPDYMAGANLIQCLLLGLIMVLLPPYLGALRTTLLTLFLAALVIAANLLLWQQLRQVLPLAPPLLVLVLLYPLQLLLGYVIETRSHLRLSGLFGQYVPPALVDEMRHQHSDFGLGGESREMTVLFSDIRGFTSLSERLTPQQLTQLMNTYLTPMTAIVHDHRGTIDKYIGDALMAFWGAPLTDRHHAHRALLAALEMLRQLQQLNLQLQALGLPPISIGIGLNSGEMSVGNMGSQFRMAYTVLGDAVNLGARLEGLTKTYGVSLIVSERLVESIRHQPLPDAGPPLQFRLLDKVQVKGKQQAVTIYEPLAPDDAALIPWLAQHQQAMEAYQAQRWDQAEALCAALQNSPLGPAPYPLYRQRIAHLRQQPANPEWDGVFIFEHK